MYNIPYKTKVGIRTDGLCPICLHSPGVAPFRDTSGHILGSCTHPDMKACYISRHNKALCTLQRALHNLSHKSGMFTIMDATAASALPNGVHSNRIPRWMLPHVLDNKLAKLRPDMLLIDGLSHSDLAHIQPLPAHQVLHPTELYNLQQQCIVHVVELGYTSDFDYCHTNKARQHTDLVELLLRAGWNLSTAIHDDVPQQPPPPPPSTNVDPPVDLHDDLPAPRHITPPPTHVHILILGSSGILYRNIKHIFPILGIPASSIAPILRKLHILSVQTAYSLVNLRRTLENHPSHFHANLPPDLDDPP
jgi:hypothetical protein